MIGSNKNRVRNQRGVDFCRKGLVETSVNFIVSKILLDKTGGFLVPYGG